MRKGVIFDMDGVLVDNREQHIEAFVIFCRRYGVDFTDEMLAPLYGMGNDEIMTRLLPPDVVQKKGITALANEKEAIYREIYAATIEPTPGLTAFLADLRRAGIRCAVGSSGQQANVDFVLDSCHIRDSFDAIVDGDMVTQCKPDPEIFLTAAKLLNLQPAECVVIEDSLAGIEAANRGGMGVIAMATTNPQSLLENTRHDLIVDDFTTLNAEIIKQL